MAMESCKASGTEVAAGRAAIRSALKALRRRHLVEEGAHAAAFEALSRPFAAQDLEWKEKAEKLELELQQCYKAQSRLSEQLVVEIEEGRTNKGLLQEKESQLSKLQDEFTKISEENVELKGTLEEKVQALDLLLEEHKLLKAHLEETLVKLRNTESENKSLIDRWMLEKMNTAEKLNEMNTLYEESLQRLKEGTIQQNALREADGIIRRTEAGYDESLNLPAPSFCKRTIKAHEGGCGPIVFKHHSDQLISSGQDGVVRVWNAQTGTSTTLQKASVGSILDLAINNDNTAIIAACSERQSYVWDAASGRVRHTLSGHREKVCSVDASLTCSTTVATASHDHSIRIWNIKTGFCTQTILSPSNCNSVAFVDTNTVYSGHSNGSLQLWDIRSGKCTTQVAAAHPFISSVCVSQNGTFVLTTGRDNVHKLFDVRTLEVIGTFGTRTDKPVSSWGRPCISPSNRHIAAGTSDGSIYVWSIFKDSAANVLKEEHPAAIHSCAWSRLGLLASADKIGNIFIWN